MCVSVSVSVVRPLPEDAQNQDDELESPIANGNRPGKRRDLWEEHSFLGSALGLLHVLAHAR